MESIKIVLLCIVSAMLYGILHDQVTTRVCVEYFTIGHPPIFRTDEPTILALGWGVLATWWVGGLLSLLVVPACRLGTWPKWEAAHLLRPIGVLLVVMACASTAGGDCGVLRCRRQASFDCSDHWPIECPQPDILCFWLTSGHILPPTASASWEASRSVPGCCRGVGGWQTKDG